MKHVFIINPKSNSEAFTEKFRHKIEGLCVNRGLEFEIKSTAKNFDAENFARSG